MKIVVIGGGTAGYIAAAHISQMCPIAELHLVYDSRIPSIGVGEGTTPIFAHWIHKVCGLSGADLRDRCEATPKYGIIFENWGPTQRFEHNFYPTEKHAYHLSATELVTVLKDSVDARRHDARVLGIERSGSGCVVCLEGGQTLSADFVVDASGFPRESDNVHRLQCLPTNAAFLRRGPPIDGLTSTRAVARPHGWIFVIPLTSSTSYGYVFNADLTTEKNVGADLTDFAEEEEVYFSTPGRCLRFPSFRRREFYDGVRFRIGNAASFLEPLEATAIGLTITQVQLAALCILERCVPPYERRIDPDSINRGLGDLIDRLALFISWHYSEGSRYSEPFWSHAVDQFEAARSRARDGEIGRAFDRFLAAGSKFPQEKLAGAGTQTAYDRDIAPLLTHEDTFASFTETSFAEIGNGIGWYHAATHRQ